MRKRCPGFTDVLIVGNLALFIFLFVQIPRLTRVRLLFSPRVPAGLCTGPVSAATDPQRELPVLDRGSLLGGAFWSNLIDGRRIRLPPAAMLPDGLQLRFSDT